MQIVRALSIVAILIVASSGCGPGESRSGDGRTDAERQQDLRESTFGGMTEALERAQDVEQLQRDRRGQLDEALEGSAGR
jgi:hypothetical protein